MPTSRRREAGFTLIELIIAMCILAILSSIAINFMRDYTRRARVSEVVLAANQCKTMVSESYPTFDAPPAAGGWGCEGSIGNTRYAGGVQTTSDGVIRVLIVNMDQSMDGKYVYMIPAQSDGVTPMHAETDIGNGVRAWICGSDLLFVRNALPANCRTDTTSFSTHEFAP